MMTPSEAQPHSVVLRRIEGRRTVGPLDNYQEAWLVWRMLTTVEDPWDIRVIATGRVIDPGTPVIDVNE